MTPLAPHLAEWLRKRLPVERGASRHTIDSYAYAFQLLVAFAADSLGTSPSDLAFEHLNATLVLGFLEHLQRDRGNRATTRNARLAAIHSFMRFMEYREPSALHQIRQVLAVPMQRTDTHPVQHLGQAEVQALLDAPDPATWAGTRDRALLHLAVTSGIRVSELVGLRLADVTFRGNYVDLYIRGKGRKERALTLWKVVANSIRAWLAVRGDIAVPELFVNARRKAITRGGAAYILGKHLATAQEQSPSLKDKRVSPHVLRHNTETSIIRSCDRPVQKSRRW
jgi:integrase/recombinase XerD